MFQTKIKGVLILRLVTVLILSAMITGCKTSHVSELPAKAAGPVVDGLQMRLSVHTTDHSDDPSLEITFQDVGEKDFVLNLGEMLGNGRYQLPSRIGLKIVNDVGKTWNLNFFDKRFPGIAGRMDDYVVPLRAGSEYTLQLRLNEFVLPDTGSPLKLPAGHYEIMAEFQGAGSTITNTGMEGVKLLNFWKGNLESNVAVLVK